MTKTISYQRVSTELPDFMVFVPNKKAKVFGGELFTPRELGIEIVEANLKAIRKLRKKRRKGEVR